MRGVSTHTPFYVLDIGPTLPLSLYCLNPTMKAVPWNAGECYFVRLFLISFLSPVQVNSHQFLVLCYNADVYGLYINCSDHIGRRWCVKCGPRAGSFRTSMMYVFCNNIAVY
jgi:hypothetical protein